jgi:hypothetical protein
MKEKIRENINNPEELERLYRDDRKSFESGFEKVNSEIENSELARFWKIRLDYEKALSKTKQLLWSDVLIMIAACLISGFLIKIPTLFNVNLHNFLFYEKNAGTIVFLGLTIYTIWTNRIFEQKKLIITIMAFCSCGVFMDWFLLALT